MRHLLVDIQKWQNETLIGGRKEYVFERNYWTNF